MTSVIIPNSVTSIEGSAFSYCSGLTSISVEEGNKVYDSRDNCNAIIISETNELIQGCTNTVIPNTVDSIRGGSFGGIELKKIIIPTSVKKIDESTFRNCGVETVEFHCKNIGKWFADYNSYSYYSGSYQYYFKNLNTINLGEEVETIESGAFNGLESLSAVHISDIEPWCRIKYGDSSSNPLSYAHKLYLNGEEVKKVAVPSSITSINDYAFYGCYSLTSITIPNSVSKIGRSAFEYCRNLFEVSIQDNMEQIDRWAFSGCSELKKVVCESLTPPAISTSLHSTAIVYVDSSVLTDYQSATGWKDMNIHPFPIMTIEDFTLLKSFYEEMQGEKDWNVKWTFGEKPTTKTGVQEGIFVDDNHVSIINLAGFGLKGKLSDKLFRLSKLSSLSLKNNDLNCSVDDVFDKNVLSNENIKTLDLSNNKLTGDLSSISNCLTGLTSLDVSNNCISRVSSALPNKIAVKYDGQTLGVIPFSVLMGKNQEMQVPNIMAYSNRVTYLSVNETEYTKTIRIIYDKNSDKFEIDNYNNLTSIYKISKGSLLDVSYSRPVDSYSSYNDTHFYGNILMDFYDGDTNLDYKVDATDLQQIITYAVSEEASKLFNISAADLQQDDWINVQDVVSMVNLMLNQDYTAVRTASSSRRKAPIASETLDAQIYWRGNQLMVSTTREVSTIDLVLENAPNVKWLLNDGSFDHAIRMKNGLTRIIGYNLHGNSLGTGETAIAEITGGDARVVYAHLVDNNAETVATSLSGIATGIDDTNACNDMDVKFDGNGLYINVGSSQKNITWQIFTLGGQLIVQGTSTQANGNIIRLNSPVGSEQQVIVRITADGNTITKKININR